MKLVRIFLALFCLVWLTGATWLPLFKTAGGGAFAGPGDVVGSALFWSGLRAYSAATRGNRIANLCNSTGGVDVLCVDAISNATTGALVIPGSLTTFCPGSACTIQTLYDQTGANSCGGAACDFTESVVANRPVLTASCIGSLACAQGNGSSQAWATTVSSPTNNQPITYSSVISRAAVNTNGSNILVSFSAQPASYYDGVANQLAIFAGGSNANAAITENATHAIQIVFNAASSSVTVDTTTTSSLNPGSVGFSGSPLTILGNVNRNNYFCQCNFYEAGAWAIVFSGTNIANMNSNQHSYWGF